MALRARFPGRPGKNSTSRQRVSYGETVNIGTSKTSSTTKKKAEEADYEKIASQTATNLKAFRKLFGTSEEEDEVFTGFRNNGKLVKSCKKKMAEINNEIKLLERQLKPAKAKTLKVLSKTRNNISSTNPADKYSDGEAHFSGFSDADPIVETLKKRKRLISRQIVILSGSEDSLSTTESDKRVRPSKYRSNHRSNLDIPAAHLQHSSITTSNYSSTKSADKSSTKNDIRQSAEKMHNLNASGVKADSITANGNSQKEDVSSTSALVVPDDRLNFRIIKGPRVKQVSYSSGMNSAPPLARFCDIKESHFLNSGGNSIKDFKQVPSTLVPGSLRSGKFTLESEDEEIEFEDEDFDENNKTFLSANGEIFLDRQGGRMRRKRKSRKKLIKPLGQFDLNYIDKYGFPVLVDRSVGSLPPKPLCFLCGSAGIEQLIFCSSCCEPFHPFCTTDASILSLFLARTVPKTRPLQEAAVNTMDDLLKNPLRVYYIDDSNSNHVKNFSGILSPPLTPSPRPFDQCEDNLLKEREVELFQHLREWKCDRCTHCEHCGLHKREGDERKNDFLKCWNCRLSFHMGCVYKKGMKKDLIQKWACGNCFKCKSCQKKIEGKSFEINCESDDSEGGVRNGKFMFCKECIRKRQRGSFCPLCHVCYDDDDYDTRMMECGSCQRWIHGKCENMSEEHYQILSSLPESVEYICRLCDSSGSPFWRQAIKLELLNGCEAVLRIFHKKALTTTRKPKTLNFDQQDDVNQSINTDVDLVSLDFVDTNLDKNKSIDNEEKLSVPLKEIKPTDKISDFCINSLTVVVRDFMKIPLTTEENLYRSKLLDSLQFHQGITPAANEMTPAVEKLVNNDEAVLSPAKSSNELTPKKKIATANEVEICSTKSANDLTPVKSIASEAATKTSGLKISSENNAALDSFDYCVYSPTKCVNSYVDSYLDIDFHSKQFTSVLDLNVATIEFLEDSFGNYPPKLESLQYHFNSALKEVFPWFNAEEIKKLDLRASKSTLNTLFETNRCDLEINQNEIGKNKCITHEKASSISRVDSILQDPFEDVYWEDTKKTDLRECSFCHGIGDSPPDYCGRLLWAGLNEWAHVNCALWSAEVWEGDDGALQQVGIAMIRSKTLRCNFCQKYGASLGCCHSSCSSSYHFPCALNSNCFLMEDKKVFCSVHGKKVKGEVQQDMEVMRQVFVDLEWIRKKEKEKLVWSSDLRVCIGSLRIDHLGEILPISAFKEEFCAENSLIPVQFACTRIFWSPDQPFHKAPYSISTIVGNRRPDGFRNEEEDNINFLVDHSKEPPIVERNLRQIEAFREWINICPIYIDEYKITWLPSYPFQDKNLYLVDGNEADVEDNICKEDIEVQTSFSSCSTRGTSISPCSPQLSCRDESELLINDIFTDCLTPDAARHLSSFVDDLSDLFVDDIWTISTDIRSENENMELESSNASIKQTGRKYPDHQLMQIDGAYDVTSESDSSNNPSSESEGTGESSNPDSKVKHTSYKKVIGKLAVRRGRSATSDEQTKRVLRKRTKLPLQKKRTEENKCPKCKKSFQTNASLNRHFELCKSKSKLQTQTKKGANSGENSQQARRGRPPKVISKEDVKNAPAPTTSKSAIEFMMARTARKQALLTAEVDESDSESSSCEIEEEKVSKNNTVSPMEVEIKPETLIQKDDKPNAIGKLSCPKCHNRYRTEESLKKHLGTCNALSSSDGDESLVGDAEEVSTSVPSVLLVQAKCLTPESEEEVLNPTTPAEDTDIAENVGGQQVSPIDTNFSIAPTSSVPITTELPFQTLCNMNTSETESIVFVSPAEADQAKELCSKPLDISGHCNKDYIVALHNLPINKDLNEQSSSLESFSTQLNASIEYAPPAINAVDSKPLDSAYANTNVYATSSHNLDTNLEIESVSKVSPTINSYPEVDQSDVNTTPQGHQFLPQCMEGDLAIRNEGLPPQIDSCGNQNVTSNAPFLYSNLSHQQSLPTFGNVIPGHQFVEQRQAFLQDQLQRQLHWQRSVARNFSEYPQGQNMPSEVTYNQLQSHEPSHTMYQSQYQNMLIQDSNGQLISVRVPVQNSNAGTHHQPQKIPQNPYLLSYPGTIEGNNHSNMLNYQQQLQSQRTPESSLSTISHNHHQYTSHVPQQYFVPSPANHSENTTQQVIPEHFVSHPNTTASSQHDSSFSSVHHRQQSPENITYVVLQHGNSFSTVPLQVGPNERAISQFERVANSQHQSTHHVHRSPRSTNVIEVLPTHSTCTLRNPVKSSPVFIHNQDQDVDSRVSNTHLAINGSESVAQNSSGRCLCVSCQGQKAVVVRPHENVIYSPKKSAKQLIPTREFSQLPIYTQLNKSEKVRCQLREKPGQRVLLCRSRLSSPVLPKLLPATISSTLVSSTHASYNISSGHSKTSTSSSLPNPVASTILPGKSSVPNPNIAVVRPMEHPLMSIQKMSDQIEHNSFIASSPTTVLSANTTPASPPNISTSSDATIVINQQEINKVHQELQNQITSVVACNFQVSQPSPLPIENINSVACNQAEERKVIVSEISSSNNKLEHNLSSTVCSSKAPEILGIGNPSVANKAIKITLKRKEGGDSYSINSISAPGSQATGTMRSLKIKAKITSGEQAGISTDVEVQPVVHTVPIPNESEANRTVCEDPNYRPTEMDLPSNSSSSISQNEVGSSENQLGQEQTSDRLTHKAVIVYKVKCNNVELFQSSDVRAVWGQIFEMVQGKRMTQNLPPLSYPATNISLPDNKCEAQASFNQLGLKHRAVQFLLEQLPGVKKAANANHEFKFHEGSVSCAEDINLPDNPTGCARTEAYGGRKPFDMFGWLASKHRRPLSGPTQIKSSDVSKVADLPIAMKFRNLAKVGSKHLQVFWSVIHGRGLFSSKDIEAGEMIIEYAGELIRPSLCDSREKYYESKGIGCYMFRVDDYHVVDATMKGNAARFINHSCEPNCRSKITEIFGKKRILIFALRKIQYGEELTYDYKFPYEEVKIPCSCGTSKCKKFLN